MLIPFDQVYRFLAQNGKPIRGILHIGAHECEEKEVYNQHNISDENIVWIDGNDEKITLMKTIHPQAKLYTALIDEVSRDITFYITNNGQSSSILPLDTHKLHYPSIIVSEEQYRKTTTLKEFVELNTIDIKNLNFWNLDIQGVELSALKGAGDYIQYADAIYSEVNIEHLYKDCALLQDLDHFLNEKGFERVAIKMMNEGWGDALYLRKRLS